MRKPDPTTWIFDKGLSPVTGRRTTVLGDELGPVISEFVAKLDQHDPLMQQQIIELLLSAHAFRMPSHEKANFVIDGVCKHARQIVAQWAKENWG